MGIKNFPVRVGPCPSLHCPPPLLEKYIFFALPSMNGPLPAELKFRENTSMSAILICENDMISMSQAWDKEKM